MQALESFNWVDILIILLLLRSVYTGARIGLTAELFRLIGTLLSILLGFHYYNQIAVVLTGYINVPLWLAQFIILLVIVLSFRVIFKYGVVLVLRVLNIQFISHLERVGGAIIGLGRGFLIGGLFLIVLLFFPFEYLYSSICEKSILASYLINSTKKTYVSIINIIPTQQPKEIMPAPPEKKTKPNLRFKSQPKF